MALEVAMDLLQPRLLQAIVDVGIPRGDLAFILRTGGWMLAVAAVGLIGGIGCTVCAVLAGIGLGTDLRRDMFGKVQDLSFGNLDRLEAGSIITRLTSDVTQMQELAMMLLRIMVRAPLLLVGSIVMGILTSRTLALLFFFLIPAVLIIVTYVVRKTFPLFARVQACIDRVNTIVQENLAGVRVVKSFVRSDYEAARFGDANDALMQVGVAAARVNAATMPLVMLVFSTGFVATLWIGGLQAFSGGLEVGRIIAFSNYLMQALMSLMMVSMLVMRLSRSEASARRIGEVMAQVPEVPTPTPGDTMTPASRDGRGAAVAFEGVTMRYGDADADPVLRDISFEAMPGETVAVLGATGSGKSSLVHLIARFYDVSEGRVTIDGVDVRRWDERALRAAVAVVPQETVLFSGSIADNIRYGRPEAPQDEIEAVAEIAQAHDFTCDMPDGYETELSQRGANLSGGQKQRIAIARALLMRSPILILDDCTSAVDVETEARILDGLLAGEAARTCFIVTQRVATAMTAHRILLLDDGKIAAQGSHAELMATSPLYRDIVQSQAPEEDSHAA